jgi:hypothetical protein
MELKYAIIFTFEINKNVIYAISNIKIIHYKIKML